jgi:transposase
MSLFLKKYKYPNGKTYLSIVDGYRANGKVVQKVVQKLGYLEDLKLKYDDPIKHYTNVISEMKNSQYFNEYPDKIRKDEKISNNDKCLNVGYVILKLIYEDLEIKSFLKSKNKNLEVKYDLNKIFSLLVFSRILYPGSKKETYEGKKGFFESFDGFSLKDLYRSLDYFASYKNEIEKLLWENTKDKYIRDTSNLYYDCTNYYFEINYNDEDLVDEEGNILEKGYRKRGPEKNHRPDPIVEMGLLMDANDIPISYDLFPGNESEKLSLLPIARRTKASCNLGRTVIVADRGLNTSDNIFYLAGRNDKDNMDGYIYGQSVRGADKEFKEWVLNQEGYINTPILNKDGSPEMFRQMIFKDDKFVGYEKKPGIFRHKSRIYPKELTITRDGKRNTKVKTDQKQMVYYSQKYADKQKRDRNQMIERAKDLIANPKKYNRITASGSASYINNIKFDKKTGNVADGLDLSLKLDKIVEEEKYDGYYSIVTSELNMSDEELRKKYRGLAKIEESFKITKTEFDARPVYVWTNEHIEAHFLVCFVSLVITRLLEQKTEHKYSLHKMIDSMKNYNCYHDFSNIYRFNYYDNVLKEFQKVFEITLDNKRLSRQDIKKILNY